MMRLMFCILLILAFVLVVIDFVLIPSLPATSVGNMLVYVEPALKKLLFVGIVLTSLICQFSKTSKVLNLVKNVLDNSDKYNSPIMKQKGKKCNCMENLESEIKSGEVRVTKVKLDVIKNANVDTILSSAVAAVGDSKSSSCNSNNKESSGSVSLTSSSGFWLAKQLESKSESMPLANKFTS